MSISDLIDIYINLFISENEKYNLTGLKTSDEIRSILIDDVINNKHIFECYKSIIDIGSGNGSFCIPLSLISNNIKIYSIDPNNKKISFQKLCIEKLSIRNMQLIRGRFDEILKKSSVDCVVIRALYHVNILCELMANYIKLNGILHIFSNHIPDNTHILSTGFSIYNTIPIRKGYIYLLKKDRIIPDYKPRKLKYLQNIFK